MEELKLVDFSKVKKKRPLKNENILNKFAETSEVGEIIISKVAKEEKEIKIEDKSADSPLEVEGDSYSYDFLLDRVTNLIKAHNPTITDTIRGPIKLPVPVINRVGSSRSAWTNFGEVCSGLNRSTEHLYQFILAELGVQGSLGAENQFLLKGRYNNKHIESVLKKYVIEYIQCNCKSSNTILKKDNSARLQLLVCNSCGSQRAVAQIKQAVNRQSKK
jgi:translation initiation factor 2 subunit 2